jgi:Cu2+-exporting ATPase
VRQNLAWAAGYNLVALPLAATGFIAPWMAAIGMSASSLLVVLNALRLSRPPRSRAVDRAPAMAGAGA